MADFQAIASNFPEFSGSQVQELIDAFKSYDTDSSGSIDSQELEAVLRSIGENPSASDLARIISEVDADKSGDISFEEFLTVI